MADKNKDLSEKTLEAWNDVFSDIMNVLLFNGERLVKEEDLESDEILSTYKVDGILHEEERDVSKIWKNNEVRISIIGFENQTKVDYKMPLRIMGYDGASYRKQLLDKKLKKNYPVITIVLYFGEKHWTAPKNLLGCFDELDDKLKPFVNDYKINVFEIAWLDDEKIKMFTSDFKAVAKYFQVKRRDKEYIGTNEVIKHVDETMKMLSTISGDDIFVNLYAADYIKKEGITMCELVQKIMKKGINKGQALDVENLIKAKAGTVEQIAQWLKLPLEFVKQVEANISVSAQS